VKLKLTELEKTKLESQLLNMTHRTYLWLKLIFEVIRQRQMPRRIVTEKSLKQAIEMLPNTVDKAYEEILEKSEDKNLARKLLCIIVSAVRPLTVMEMNIALAIEDHHRSYKDLDLEPEDRFRRTLRHLCGLFVNVIDEKVYLIHQTAKEFLLAKNKVSSDGWKNSISPAVSELTIARTCITHLLFTGFGSGFETGAESRTKADSEVKQRTDKHHYLGHAASH